MSASVAFGNYLLCERIAEGGMAEVWRARSRGVAGFEKTVVIKRVLPSLLERPGFAELLVREAKIAARLSHPNIIQIYDLGEQDGSYFIAMELLRGRDLAAALSYRERGSNPLGLGLRLWIASEVAKALDYAHRARLDDGKPMCIVHRDVSPQNILLGFEGEVKVADFGIARANEPGLGRGEDPKILRGKYAYMSPEQARGEPLDNRSDIFSFGILLYELVTGRRMFRGVSTEKALEMLRDDRMPNYAAQLQVEEVKPIVHKALSTDPAARFSSAGEIHGALLQVIFGLGRPVGARDLSIAMRQMFSDGGDADPNKLRSDLMVRAYDDAASVTELRRLCSRASTVEATAQTAELPTSRRRVRQHRRVAYLACVAVPGGQPLFEAAVALAGGRVLDTSDGLRFAVFGLAGAERAVRHAVRGGLELRRSSRLRGRLWREWAPAMTVFAANGGSRPEGASAVPAALVQVARELLLAVEDGELRVEAALRREVEREFRVEETTDGAFSVSGFRSRRDRDAGALRRRTPLVGRRETLRVLSGMLIEAAAGRGAVAHVVGAPGVGKSRLLAELRSAAAPHDFVFVHGRADEAAAERSFAAFSDLVMDLCGIELEDAPAQRFAKVERLRMLGLTPRQVRLLGELVGLAYPVPTGERAGRPRGIEIALSVGRAIRALSLDRVVVLALEDLHWMDDATRQVLPLLVGGLRDARVVVLVMRRPGSTGPLPSAARSLEVRPLDCDASGRLLAHHLGARAVDPELSEYAHRVAGGIPAWIEWIAAPLGEAVEIEDGVAHRASAWPELRVPTVVRSVVSARAARLRPRERSMLRVAAALGGVIEIKLLCSIEGLVGRTERPILRRLWVRRLLVDVDKTLPPPTPQGAWGGDEVDGRLPERVRLPSELLRRAVLAELDDGELARLHSRIVATLERHGACSSAEGMEKLAWHAGQSVDRRRAPDYYARAAEAALQANRHDRASEHLRAAARLAREVGGDEGDVRAFDLGLRAAGVALDAGLLESATLALVQIEVGVLRARASQQVAHAIVVARHARQRLEGERAIEALSRVEPLLDDVSDRLRDVARTLLARTCIELGAVERGLTVLDSILGSATGSSRGAAFSLRAKALARLDDLDASERAVNEALAVAARLGDPELRYGALASLAVWVEATGQMAEAAARYAEAAEVAASVAGPDDVARLLASAAVASLAAGEIEVATKRTEEAGRWADRSTVETWRLVVTALRAALAIREHPDASFVPGLVRCVERLEEMGRPAECALAVEMLVHAHLALGDKGAAGRTLARAAAHAARAGHRNYARRLNERRRALVM